MLCNLGFKTDFTLSKSAIRFKQLKKMKFDTPISICENGNMSSVVSSIGLNPLNIPSVELFVVNSYNEKRVPTQRARFFAYNEEAYKSLCLMTDLANFHKYYSPRITISDLILEGNIVVIVDPDFLFINELPKEKIFIAVNANEDIANKIYLQYNPVFFYDSYGLTERDMNIVELLSARGYKHEGHKWYYDESHYQLASLIPDAITNYKNLLTRHSKPIIECKDRYPIYCKNASDYFDVLVEAGFKRKCPESKEYRERLNYETSVIKTLHYENYFLINFDFINWSRKHNIPIGPGRGSAAGSIVAYCLDITKLDPIQNGLYFERFLNPERVSPPDIDTDISTNDRQFVIDYIKTKYGTEYVSQIVTFSELKSKSALKDAARLYNINPEEINRITSYFPPSKFGTPPTLNEAYEIELVKDWAENNKSVWKEALELEGFIRQTGIHAAGLIISPKPINELTGVSYEKGERICQLDKKDSEKFGLLKMDFLGLATLGLIKDTMNLLGKSYYDMENIPLNDPKIFEAFARAETHGIFQFESDGMQKILTRIKPTNFADIAAATALYRPGPLMSGLTDDFIHNKHSVNPEYTLPEFKDLMAETYGVFVYQEEVMLVSQKIAGFTLAKADNLRKAIGKKDKILMKTMENAFINGAINNGYDKELIQKLWLQILKFADYCFNKSHSYAYALLSYWTMYLKIYYPKEFAASLLSLDLKDSAKLRSHFFNLKDKVEFLPPLLNEAEESFKLTKDGVMMGYGSIKGMGNASIGLANNKPYSSIIQVFEKNKLDKTQLATLIYSGAFDHFEKNKAVLLGNIDRILKFNKSNENSDIFNLFEPSEIFALDYGKKANVPSDAYMEKTCYGFNVHSGFLNENKWLIESLKEDIHIGIISEIKRTKTKKDGKDMAILTIETVRGKMKAVLFTKQYAEYGTILEKEQTYAFRGILKTNTNSEDENETSLIIYEMVNELGIVVTQANLYSDNKIKVKDIDKSALLGFIKPGCCDINIYESDLDGESNLLFKLYENMNYDKSIHEKVKEMGFRIELNVF
jgi:DNA polymerase-3 subunit alpha